MAVASHYTFCTRADVERRLSAEGVRSRLDVDQDGAVSASEELAMTDAISDASETLLYYLWAKYDPTILGQSAWVNRRAVDYATYVLAGLAAETIPDSIWKRVQEAERLLLEIRDGPGMVPLLPLRRGLAPVWSNTRIVPWFQFKCIRVEPNTSSPRSRFYARQDDYEAMFTFEI